ncbi:thioesterase domain-containing protein [Nocardia arthritidis]|nr:thioesterase domain-containing protein [Nocardia arthritidis]
MNRQLSLHPPLVRNFAPDRAPGSVGVPMVQLHPGGFSADVYQPLAEKLEPVFDLHVVDMDGVREYFEAPFTTGHPDIAFDALVARIRDGMAEHGLLPGTNDWLLSGWSFGGVVGYAIAQQLPEHQRPRGLLLLDCIAPIPLEHITDEDFTEALYMPWFASYLGAKRNRPLNIPHAEFANRDDDSALAVLLEHAVAAGALAPATSVAGLRKLWRTYFNAILRQIRLTRTYRPDRSTVPLWLLRAGTALPGMPDSLGWELYADEVPTRFCDADHYSLILGPDNIGAIAESATEAYQSDKGVRAH